MPTYDYVCDQCQHEFEAFESIKADPQKVCPSCSEPRLRRKIGAGAAILFKGSGFYQTDYRSDSYKKRAEADKPGDAKPSTSTSESTSAPAAATAAKATSSTSGGGNGNGTG
jgi:putative FmdB family regulatory protein